jgi:hypothetical protein
VVIQIMGGAPHADYCINAEERSVNQRVLQMVKYVVAAFMAFGALLGGSAQAAPPSPAFVQTQVTPGDAIQRVWRRWSSRRARWGHLGHGRLGSYRKQTE